MSKTAAVVLVDAADTAGQPAALFPYGKGTTLLEAVLELIAGFGAATVTVLAREQLAEQVEAAVPVGITVVPYADLSAGLAVNCSTGAPVR